jgi:hypothetical protein
MKSIVLYSSETPSPDHQPIVIRPGIVLFIRPEIVDNDMPYALDNANPREGEIVLNSVPYPNEED